MTEIIYTPLRLDAALYRIEASMHISDEDAPIVAHAYRILQARIEALEKAANEQAEDEGLWFVATTAPEAYLQRALRRLHALIEGDTAMATLAKEKP